MPNAKDDLTIAVEQIIEMLLAEKTPDKIVSKTELQNLVAQGKSRECFEHDIYGSFDITEMRNLSAAFSRAGLIHRITTPLAPLAEHVRKDRDFELDRIANLPPEALDDPVLGVQLPSGETILIDGTHRVLRREQDGHELIRMYLWPMEVAEQFGRIQPGWGKLPGVDWGDPEFFAKKRGENHGE